MKSIKLHTNDLLIKNDDDSFTYRDSYGESTELSSAAVVFSWASQEGICLTDEQIDWIEEE
jgi:hypothetical protein